MKITVFYNFLRPKLRIGLKEVVGGLHSGLSASLNRGGAVLLILPALRLALRLILLELRLALILILPTLRLILRVILLELRLTY